MAGKNIQSQEATEKVYGAFKEEGEQMSDFVIMNIKAYCACESEADIPMISPKLLA